MKPAVSSPAAASRICCSIGGAPAPGCRIGRSAQDRGSEGRYQASGWLRCAAKATVSHQGSAWWLPRRVWPRWPSVELHLGRLRDRPPFGELLHDEGLERLLAGGRGLGAQL